jgi:hypothetical protein
MPLMIRESSIHVVRSYCYAIISFFLSLLYSSNSCTSLHFKTLKSHTKTLKIRPPHVLIFFETIFRRSMAMLRYVTELQRWFTFVIKSVGIRLVRARNLGIESRWGGRDFPHPCRPALGPTHPPIQGYRVCFLVVKWPGSALTTHLYFALKFKKE